MAFEVEPGYLESWEAEHEAFKNFVTSMTWIIVVDFFIICTTIYAFW